MKTYFHTDFYKRYVNDLLAEDGRMEPIIELVGSISDIVISKSALDEDISKIHNEEIIEKVKSLNIYDIALLAAGASISAAENSFNEISFAAVRPAGHHASEDKFWGCCYFNNIAISIQYLLDNNKINSAFVLDFDYHFGDGTVNIFKKNNNVEVFNPEELYDKDKYLNSIYNKLDSINDVDIIAVSAGFDNHVKDICGGILRTDDYYKIGVAINHFINDKNIPCYAILEGGYTYDVLTQSIFAFFNGLNKGE